MNLPIYNQNGEQTGTQELNPAIFDIPIKPELVNEAVTAQLANKRAPIAHTKDRGDVRGGGKKPWKQKGTGRARQGSIRSPLWKGGGVTFGPLNTRNFSKKINKKAKRLALCMGLTDKTKHQNIKILNALELPEIKTKQITFLFKQLDIQNKKIMIALSGHNAQTVLSARNIPRVSLTAANSLNIIDILQNDIILTTVAGIETIEKTYGNS